MAQVGINQAKSREERAQWIYQQKQLLRMVRGSGKIAREEHREYLVLPTAEGSRNSSLISTEDTRSTALITPTTSLATNTKA